MWGAEQVQEGGNRFWLTLCNNYRIIASEWCQGVRLPLRYTVWERRYDKTLQRADYSKIGELRSKSRAEWLCEEYNEKDLPDWD